MSLPSAPRRAVPYRFRQTLELGRGFVSVALRDGTVWLPAGSFVAGLAAYAFLAWGARGLGSEAFAPIAALWTVQYLVMATALFAVEQFVVRLMSASGGDTAQLRQLAPTLLLAIGGVAIAALLIDAAIVGPNGLAVVGGLWVVTVGALTLARGVAGGRASYREAGIATGSDAVTRLVLAAPVILFVGTTASLALTLPLGPVPFVIWWWLRRNAQPDASPDRPRTSPIHGWRAPFRGTAVFLATTAYANGSLQLLLGIGPLVVMALDGAPRDVSAFFATAALARAPLLIAMGAVPRVLNPLTRRAAAGDYAVVRRLSWLVAAGTLVVAGCAWVVGAAWGPKIVGALYGDGFAISGMATGVAAGAVTVALGALALNQVIVAENRPKRLVPVWTIALLVAGLVVILVPLEPLVRVSLAALAGQIAAICGLVAAITLVRK